MKVFFLALALGIIGVALIVATVLLAKWAGFSASPVSIMWELQRAFVGLLRLAFVLLALSLIAVPILFAAQFFNRAPDSRGSDGLSVLSFSAPGLGLLGALYGGWIVYVAMVRTHTVSLPVIAPSLAELSLLLGVGFLTGACAAAANAVLINRARKA